ncbi:MAG TPA: acyl-CoA dehydrogenase family protein [Micromonospora sp.]
MSSDSFTEAAEELAELLRSDAADRDLANQTPVRELELVRTSNLLGVPPDDLATAHAVTRVVAAADASIGHLLGLHYLSLWRLGLLDEAGAVAGLHRATVEQRWLWTGVGDPDGDIRLTPAGDGFTLDGRQACATGASLADRLIVDATRADTGDQLTVLVDAQAAGVSHPADQDDVGQRLSASGRVHFDGVRVGADQVVGAPPADERDPRTIRWSLSALAHQSILTQIYVALAEGALVTAAAYTREQARPWPLSGVGQATRDPYVLAGYGELVAEVRAAGLLADQAVAALREAADQGLALTPEQRGITGVTISSAKVVATRVATGTTSAIFDLVDGRGTAARFGLDRFWRNARTLTLHDPVAYKAREVGAHFLTGDLPPITAYS